MNRQVILKSRPSGIPAKDNFEIKSVPEPALNEGEIKIKAKYISVDPYMRPRMSDTQGFEPGKPMEGNIVAEVIGSRHPDYKPGDAIMGALPWQEIQVVAPEKITRLKKDDFPLSHYLGILGLTGLTAYFGLLDLGKPEKGETVVVSGAAGAVGSVVGQLALLHGCQVTGITGTDEKVSFLKDKLKFDNAINYRKERDLSAAVARACPEGIDIYFDNVGGEISDAVLPHINQHARILICGQISLYNLTERPTGPRVLPIMLTKHAMMKGFTVSEYPEQFPEAIKKLGNWIKEGKLIPQQTIYKGIEKLPEAFIGLFTGANTGKMLVEL
ncbi:MAG: NADP-dependent oxidoreductase [Bacteroidales bacterium]